MLTRSTSAQTTSSSLSSHLPLSSRPYQHTPPTPSRATTKTSRSTKHPTQRPSIPHPARCNPNPFYSRHQLHVKTLPGNVDGTEGKASWWVRTVKSWTRIWTTAMGTAMRMVVTTTSDLVAGSVRGDLSGAYIAFSCGILLARCVKSNATKRCSIMNAALQVSMPLLGKMPIDDGKCCPKKEVA